jgi:hypothetical protein
LKQKNKKKINEETIINEKTRPVRERQEGKNNIWFSKYNFYICGKSGTLFLILL